MTPLNEKLYSVRFYRYVANLVARMTHLRPGTTVKILFGPAKGQTATIVRLYLRQGEFLATLEDDEEILLREHELEVVER